MPAWLEILLIALVALIVVLAVGGRIVVARRERAGRVRFVAQLEEANAALAAAHAADNGWDRDALERIACAAFAARRPGVELLELALVQVVDRPGVDEDQAVFQVSTAAGASTLVLGRHGGEWSVIEPR